MSLFWGGKSCFMAEHPPGMAVKHYRILGFVHFCSSSYGIGAERDAQVLGSAFCTCVLTFVCPSLWLTLNPTAYTVCQLSQSPRQLLCRLSEPSAPAERSSARPLAGSVLLCAAAAGTALLHQPALALWPCLCPCLAGAGNSACWPLSVSDRKVLVASPPDGFS